MRDLFSVRNKVVIVTGASQGIGEAIARGLGEAGAKVVVASRRQDVCDEVARQIERDSGVETLPIAVDVARWDALPTFVERVYERFGRVDTLVNNAGVNPMPVKLDAMTPDFWDSMFDIHVKGPLRLGQLIAPRMGDQGGGTIVNISSIGAYHGSPGIGAYTVSKAALISLTRVMAVEWARWGVRVNTISPGPFLTEIMQRADERDPGYLDRIAATSVMRRVADPAELIGAVIYLASDASSYVTGDDHLVTGGGFR